MSWEITRVNLINIQDPGIDLKQRSISGKHVFVNLCVTMTIQRVYIICYKKE